MKKESFLSILTSSKKYLIFMTYFLICFAQSTTSRANVLSIPKAISDYILNKDYLEIETVYYYSNEMKPRDALKFFHQVPKEGSYISIGNADRGYINASLAKSDSIILVDMHPGIIAFNFINTLLLRISENTSIYRHLRQHPEQAPVALYDEFSLEDSDLEKETFWKEASSFWKLIHQRFEQRFEPLLSPVGQSKYCGTSDSQVINEFEQKYAGFISLLCPGGIGVPFEEANFLYDELLFKRVKKLASTAIIARVDVTNAGELKTFKKELLKENRKIAILDITNLYSIDYYCNPDKEDNNQKYRHSILTAREFHITREEFEQLIRILKPLGHPQAKILSTQWSKNMEKATIEHRGKPLELPRSSWDYTIAALKDVSSKSCKHAQTTKLVWAPTKVASTTILS